MKVFFLFKAVSTISRMMGLTSFSSIMDGTAFMTKVVSPKGSMIMPAAFKSSRISSRISASLKFNSRVSGTARFWL